MRKILFAFLFIFIFSNSVKADIVQELTTGESRGVANSQPAMQFCQPNEDAKVCYERYDKIFHQALEKNKSLIMECSKRTANNFPQDVVEKLSKGQMSLGNGKNISLFEALQILSAENTAKTNACIFALTHTISDDMAESLGIKFSRIDHLKRFDAQIK